MHRQISHADGSFQPESRLGLYLLTAVLGLLLGADLWPIVARWVASWGPRLPSWPNEILGYRLALIAAVLGGARILYGSIDALLEGKVGADLALAIACVAAILVREPLVAAEIVFIGLVGECLEGITFERTQRAVRRIVEVCPRRCWRLRDGQEERVLTTELQVGDRIVVKPGGRIPADGVVLEGRSAVDVSALTGESLPVDKGPGDEVLAGSLNQFGALTMEARRVAEHTVVGRVIELTARALKDKAPLERTADRLARYFLPAVLGLAALTFVVGLFLNGGLPPRSGDDFRFAVRQSVYPALSVLVVACPCALILATPAAIIAALGRLAGTGVLIKGGSALERLAQVNAFAFDKTGTLTEGRLELGEVVALDGTSADELLRVAATAEQHSEHLLARLIVQEAARRGVTPERAEDFRAHPGSGVTVATSAGPVVVGNRRLLEEQGIELSSEVLALLERLDAAGQTVLLVARASKVLGIVGAHDRVRPEARGVLAALRELGITEVAMLTGDRAAAANSVAEELGVSEVHAELLPEQKAEFMARWQERRRVAMVGDGINDAPALARANVGIAIAGGTEVAAEAGDVVFMGDPLRALPLLVRLSRETVRIIRQNILIFAFLVNGVGILVTAWLWPLLAPASWYQQGPVAAVVYHQLGSFAVLINAMRLLWFERSATSPTYRRWRDRLASVNDWLEHRLDVDEGFHWIGHHWKPVVGGLATLLIAAYAFSGLTQIGPDELGVVRRFGRALPDDLEPGLHWCWPWPVETVTRLKPQRVHTVEVGFRLEPGSRAAPAARAWSSPHGNDGVQRMPDEAVMITGEGNLVELQATVRYTVSEPRVYLFEVDDADAVVRSAAESVLREVVAGRTFAELLTTDREAFQREALARLKERCGGYSGRGLGVQLEGLALLDLHPPQEVVQAYHEVTKAMESRDQQINQAQAAATSRERAQQASSLQVVREAEAARKEKVGMAKARLEAFLARYQARRQLRFETEAELFGSLLHATANGQAPADAVRDYRKRREEALSRQAALTDFRLYWDLLAAALTGREKVIVDADKVPGRRHLWLLPFEAFRVPVPVMAGPPERGPMAPPRGP